MARYCVVPTVRFLGFVVWESYERSVYSGMKGKTFLPVDLRESFDGGRKSLFV